MISLKEYLIEGILDVEDNLDKDYIKIQIEDFIKENYKITGKLKINLIKDKYIVNCNKRVEVKTKDIKSLTNGFFEWGEVNGLFNCSYCHSLQSLEGSPKEVGGSFDCSHCDKLQSLEGAPKEVGGNFFCDHCPLLQSLEGAPKEVGGDFDCSHCDKLQSLEGSPEKVGGDFICKKCGEIFTVENVKEVCKVKKCIYV